jgi:hypothetical protein
MQGTSPIVTSIVEFLTVLRGLPSKQFLRGQGNVTWPVLPSLARQENTLGWHCENWQDVEDLLLDDFKRLSAPWISIIPQDRFEWLMLAQHHGLTTVLLDWTTNPLKALFFAVEDPSHDNFDGAVFGYEPHMGWFTSTEHLKDCKDDLICFYPKHINQRLVSQEACFVAFNFPEKRKPFKPLTVFREGSEDYNALLDQIIIPATSKNVLRAELALMGITHQTIFPGLDGIATTIRRKLGWR